MKNKIRVGNLVHIKYLNNKDMFIVSDIEYLGRDQYLYRLVDPLTEEWYGHYLSRHLVLVETLLNTEKCNLYTKIKDFIIYIFQGN